jgi:hypothetical protein
MKTELKGTTTSLGVTLPLITDPEIFGTDVRVGHYQLAFHVMNRELTPARLYAQRSDPNGEMYPRWQTTLLIRVNSNHEAFRLFFHEAMEMSTEVQTAKAALEEAEGRLEAMQAERLAELVTIPQYKEVSDQARECDESIQAILRPYQRGSKTTRVRDEHKSLVEKFRGNLRKLQKQLKGLEKEHPASISEKEIYGQRLTVIKAERNLESVRDAYDCEENRRSMLLAFLDERGISNIPKELIDRIVRKDIILYELEYPEAEPPTTGSKNRERFTTELSIPWEFVLRSLAPTARNHLQRQRGQRHFAFTSASDQGAEDDGLFNGVAGQVFGEFEIRPRGRSGERFQHGWLVIFRNRLINETILNDDYYRLCRIVEPLMALYPTLSADSAEEDDTEGTDETDADRDAVPTEETDVADDAAPVNDAKGTSVPDAPN